MKGYKQTKVGLIPKEWEVVRLGEVIIGKPKYGINAPAVDYSSELPIYIRITDIDDNGNFNNSKRVSVDYKDWKNFLLEEGDILFARTGATVGKSYLYKKEDGKLVYAGYLIKFSVNKELVLPQFLKYWVNTNYYWYWVKKMSMRSGQPGINAEEYKKLPIPLPPLKEQEKIANILSTWDEAIESQEELIKEKEKFKKALMQRLLKVDGKKREPKVRFKEFSGKWKEVRLKDILIERKEYATKEDGYVHLSMSKEGIFPKIEQFNRDFLVKDENKKYKVTKKGDICYNPANLKFGVICKNEWGDGIFSPIYVTFEVNKSYDSDFIKYVVTSKDFIQKALRYQEGTVYERMAVKPDDLLLMKIYIPPTLKEQQKIAEVLSTIDKEIDLLKLELNELKKQKKALMQKLLTGKVRVRV